MKYAIYARKSSEAEERQMLSIPAQLEEMRKLVVRNPDLPKECVLLEESKSAKIPGKRDKFNELLTLIRTNQVNTLLVWQPDRISRNPLDSAQIVSLMDDDKLTRVITPTQTFANNPMDKFMLQFFMTTAKLENDRKGVDVKRGLKAKAEMGWYPTVAPLGYINTPLANKGLKTVKKDPVKFSIVKKCFEEILAGSQAVDVWRRARDEWRLTGRTGVSIPQSTFYNILSSTFYYGEFEWRVGSGNWYQGKHEPMITRDEYDTIQRMLGKYGKPIRRSHQFDLTGLMRCDVCGSAITASRKTKHYKGTNRTASYVYYHCSKKHKHIHCTQQPISEAKINEQITKQLRKLHPPQGFIEWAKRWVTATSEQGTQTQASILSSLKADIEKTEHRLNKLLEMRLDEQINEEAYATKKRTLEDQKRTLERKLGTSGNDANQNDQEISNALDLARVADKKFMTGTRETKHKLLFDISSNLSYNNGKMRIHLLDHFSELQDSPNWGKKYENWIEPQKYTDIMAKNPLLRPSIPVWLPRQGSNLRP